MPFPITTAGAHFAAANYSVSTSVHASHPAATPIAASRSGNNPARTVRYSPVTKAQGLPPPRVKRSDTVLSLSARLKQLMPPTDGKCVRRAGEAVCAAPHAAARSPQKSFLLREYETFSNEQREPNAPASSAILTFNRFREILKPAATADYFVGGTVPQTAGLDSLMKKLSPGQDYRLPAKGKKINQALVRERLAELALALFAPDQVANEVVFNDFSFLALARLKFTVSDAKTLFAAELREHRRNGPLEDKAAAWAASLILSRLHPALSRTDIPDEVVFGDLIYAKLHFAVDLLQAANLDHGNYSHRNLMDLADIAMAGAKLNGEFAKSLMQLQIPAALWFAHASGAIDLQTRHLRENGTAQKVLKLLDGAQTKALRAVWDTQAKAISALQAPKPTRTTVAEDILRRLGLNPYGVHQVPLFSSYRNSDCTDEISYLTAYLGRCKSVIEDKLKRRLPWLDTLFEETLAAATAHKQDMLAAALEVAFNRTDTQTQRDWKARKFQIRLPLAERRSIKHGEETSRQWIYAEFGAIVTTGDGGEDRHYVISPFNAKNPIEPLALANDDLSQSIKDYVMRTLTMHFSPEELACVSPCDAVEFAQPGFTSVGDKNHTRKVQLSPSREADAIDFDNTRLSLAQRILTVAQQWNVYAFEVLYGLRLGALTFSLPFASCFTTTDRPRLQENLAECGLALSPADRDRLNVAPNEHYFTNFRQSMFSAPLKKHPLEQAGERFIMQLPTAPLRPGDKLADTLPAILRESGERAAADSHVNRHRLETGSRPPIEFLESLSMMAGTDASLSELAAALGNSNQIMEGSGTPAENEIAGPPALPVYSAVPAMDASGMVQLRFDLPGVERISRVSAPDMEKEGIQTFLLDGEYYQVDARDSNPALLPLKLVRWIRDGEEACLEEDSASDAQPHREERSALRREKGKTRFCATTHTVRDNNDVEWQVVYHERNRPGDFVQRAPFPGLERQIPRHTETRFRVENEGAFAEGEFVHRPLAIVNQMLLQAKAIPSRALKGKGKDKTKTPDVKQYEEVTPGGVAGQGIPPIADLPHSIPGHLVFNGLDYRPKIEYRLYSLDGAAPSQMTGLSRIRTVIQQDFFSLPASETAPARGLVEIEAGVYYRFDLPRPDDIGLEPVNMVRLDSMADAAEIATFTTQETVMEWMRTREFEIDIDDRHRDLYLRMFDSSPEARTMVREALHRETANRRIYGMDSEVIADAVSACATPATPGAAAAPPDEKTTRALNLALTNILRSAPLTRQLQEALAFAHSQRQQNMHFEEIHIAPARPSRTGVMEYIDRELERALKLFAKIYKDFNYGAAFSGPTLEESPPRQSGDSNQRAGDIEAAFAAAFDSRNVAVAEVEQINAITGKTEIVYYHAVSGTRERPELTAEARGNPHAYILVAAGEDMIDPGTLPCLTTMTPLLTRQRRDNDTERRIAYAILSNPNRILTVRVISRLPICISCEGALVQLAELMPNTEFVFSAFPAAVKTPPVPSKGVSPRPLAVPAMMRLVTTRKPVHA